MTRRPGERAYPPEFPYPAETKSGTLLLFRNGMMSHEFIAFESEIVLAPELRVSLDGRVVILQGGNVKVFLQGRD
jgi:hypothetical protein